MGEGTTGKQRIPTNMESHEMTADGTVDPLIGTTVNFPYDHCTRLSGVVKRVDHDRDLVWIVVDDDESLEPEVWRGALSDIEDD